MTNAVHLPIIPRLSEKTYGLHLHNTYTFGVPIESNKVEIAAAVASQYGVTVTKVTTTISKGKLKQTTRKGGRQMPGRRSDFKKAYVTLAEGDSIKVFSEEQQ